VKRLEWMGALQESEPLTDGEPGVGTRYHDVFVDHGQRIELKAEIVRYEPPSYLEVSLQGDGVEATRILAAEDRTTKILILTTFDIDEYVIEAIRAGASGFLLKDVRPIELIEAIRIVARGDALLAPSVTRRLLESIAPSLPVLRPPKVGLLDALTPTERKVLALVGRGASNHEIAAELFVADTTVRTHIRHILEKLALRDRVQAVVLAYDTGLVQPHAS